jgi:hypothetical protein
LKKVAMVRKCFAAAVFAAVLLFPATGRAGEADVLAARAIAESGGTYRFEVTVRHADTGWDHYADRFEVLAPDGSVLGVRTLYHPHVAEQPFTRSLSGVQIPEHLGRVRIRARDSVHQYGGAAVEVQLQR